MTLKPCTCQQCRAGKKHTSTNTRKFFKRLLNKWRRKAKPGEVKNFYWS